MKLFDTIKKFVFAQDDEETDIDAMPSEEENAAPVKKEKSPYGDFSESARTDDIPADNDYSKSPYGNEAQMNDYWNPYGGYRERKDSLGELKHRYETSKKKEDFVALLKCLKDSKVFVPVTNDGKVRADVMTDARGTKLLPAFSGKDQINFDYSAKFSTMEMPFVKCVQLAHVMDGVEGIVLDAFTESMVLNFTLADGVVKMAEQ